MKYRTNPMTWGWDLVHQSIPIFSGGVWILRATSNLIHLFVVFLHQFPPLFGGCPPSKTTQIPALPMIFRWRARRSGGNGVVGARGVSVVSKITGFPCHNLVIANLTPQKSNELIPKIAISKGSRYLFQGPSFWVSSH